MRIENSFIPVRGVGETTERKLWQSGVTRWESFDRSTVGDVTGERIERFIGTARDRLDAGDAQFFADAFPSGSRWRCYENFREDACYLDIETTGLDAGRDEVTVVTCHRAGETTTLVRGRDLTADHLAAAIGDASLLVTFNGKRFDAPFIERNFDVTLDVPHLDLLYPCRQVDLTGGLKEIERAVDIERDRPDLSGRDAVRLWHEYERGDAGALDTLVAYNREDTLHLETLAELVTDRLHDAVFETARA